MNIQIRKFQTGDEAQLLPVFQSAIRLVAARDYTAEQIAAWAPAQVDVARWAERMQGIAPFVAVDGDAIVGYADLQPNGYIDHFFVSGNHPRKGIGGLLMQTILVEAARLNLIELTSDVSITAQPFFKRYGFEVVQHKMSAGASGVALKNALMKRTMG